MAHRVTRIRPAAMAPTGTAQWRAWDERRLPPVEQVVPGLWSIPVSNPTPHRTPRYTLCYAIVDEDGVVLVDPGWPGDEVRQTLAAGLAEAGARLSDIRGVVVTHAHRDHHGQSGSLKDITGCWVAMHAAEQRWLEHLPPFEQQRVRETTWLRRCGAPDDAISAMLTHANMHEERRRLAHPTSVLGDGDRVPGLRREIRTVWTPGHTPGHLCLFDTASRRLLTGDQMLSRTVSHVAKPAQSGRSALADHIGSLRCLAALPAIEALPAHEYRFGEVCVRAQDVIAYELNRCEQVAELVADGHQTVWDIARGISWIRDWDEMEWRARRGALLATEHCLVFLEAAIRVRPRVLGNSVRWQPIRVGRGAGAHAGTAEARSGEDS